jgi:hypothetical protein
MCSRQVARRSTASCCSEIGCEATLKIVISTNVPSWIWHSEWKYVQNYVDAKTVVIEAIIRRACLNDT